jgi:putative NIF3 family GTP cyclohydrolase 1 type 2
MNIGRRRFVRLTGAAMLAGRPAAAQRTAITVQQAIERIQRNIGAPWERETLDGVKAGVVSAELTGIATTAMATMHVLDRAVKERTNLVLTAEPVFFGRLDGPFAADDPIYAARKQFIEKNGIVVFRLTDHWRARKPDPFAVGLARAMNWTQYRVGDDALHYQIPPRTIAALAGDLTNQLNARAGIRVVGERQTRVRRIFLLPGVSALAAATKALPDCDLIVAGETREWESVEYAQDTVAAGQKKGLIMLGRVMSEDPGMNVCAEWLRGLIPEAPARWLPAGDPYWRPA